MTHSQHKQDLQRIHESEVYGIAVFDTAASLTWNARRKEKWLTLRALEEKTLARYLGYMSDSNQSVVEPTGWALKGRLAGAALGLLPWRVSMKLLGDATAPFQEIFLRLKNNAIEKDQEFFDYVYAHEKAIEAFARKELSNDRGSLEAVETLLTR